MGPSSVMVTQEGGGEVRAVTNLASDQGFNSHRHPQFMPDGRHFIYLARGNGRVDSEIRFASLDDTTHTVVTRSSMMGYYGSGYLVYAANGNLVAQPMDPDTGTVQWVNDGTGAQYHKQPHSAPSFAGVAPQGGVRRGWCPVVGAGW